MLYVPAGIIHVAAKPRLQCACKVAECSTKKVWTCISGKFTGILLVILIIKTHYELCVNKVVVIVVS